jgi:hypothetical protein
LFEWFFFRLCPHDERKGFAFPLGKKGSGYAAVSRRSLGSGGVGRQGIALPLIMAAKPKKIAAVHMTKGGIALPLIVSAKPQC